MHISYDIRNRQYEKTLKVAVSSQTGITVVEKSGTLKPNIFFIEDEPGTVNTLDKVRSTGRDFPDANIFVISADPSPDHIIAIMKAGASEYFLAPLNPQEVLEAIERVRLQILPVDKEANGTAYAFIGSKGGLGTTVLAVNTALALSGERTGRAALFDLALAAGDSGVLFDLMPKTTIADIARNFDRLDASFLSGAMEKHAAGVDLLAAPPSIEDSAFVTAIHSERVIQLLRSLYSTIVIDCPALGVDERTLAALRQADKIFIVTDLSLTAVRNASRLIKFLGKSGFSPQRVEVVVNRLAKGQSGSIEDVEKSVGKRLFWLFPNDFDSAAAAVNRGTPLLKYDPRSALARSIFDFARKLTEPAAFPNYRGIKGLLGKAI
jgi:pilus assembly protein CpaE